MVGLLSLSNELLIDIYCAAPTLESAVSLSNTNRRLRAVWLEHSNHLIASILSATTPAYEDALDLAVMEETWASSGSSDTQSAQYRLRPASPTTPTTVPARLCLRRLLRNAQLASSVANAWRVHDLDRRSGSIFSRHGSILTDNPYASVEASYYMMRKLLFARRHPEAQTMPALYAHLCALPHSAIRLHADFAEWLRDHDTPYEVKQPHGIIKPKEQWTEDEKWEADEFCHLHVHWDDWEWVNDILDLFQMSHHGHYGPADLKSLMFEDPADRKSYKEMSRDVTG
ncbi:hypothetical protein Q7P36_005910 [Cladosporium allicinum]